LWVWRGGVERGGNGAWLGGLGVLQKVVDAAGGDDGWSDDMTLNGNAHGNGWTSYLANRTDCLN